jgi:hypothetical protein
MQRQTERTNTKICRPGPQKSITVPGPSSTIFQARLKIVKTGQLNRWAEAGVVRKSKKTWRPSGRAVSTVDFVGEAGADTVDEEDLMDSADRVDLAKAEAVEDVAVEHPIPCGLDHSTCSKEEKRLFVQHVYGIARSLRAMHGICAEMKLAMGLAMGVAMEMEIAIEKEN